MSGSKHKSCGDVAGAAKCQTITVETKVKIIESGAHSYNMNHSTISMILKNKSRIKEHVKAAVRVMLIIASKKHGKATQETEKLLSQTEVKIKYCVYETYITL